LEWILILTQGTEEQKLLMGFNLCDRDGDGVISREDLTTTMQSLYHILIGLQLEENDLEVPRIVDTIFEKLESSSSSSSPKGAITLDDYKNGAKVVGPLLRTVGARATSCRACPSSRTPHRIMIGGAKWRFVMNMMMGLESAVKKINPMTGYTDHDEDEGSSVDGISSLELDSTKSVKKESYFIPTSDDTPCSITAYGAEDFASVRAALGISDEDFLLSVGVRQVIGSFLLGDLYGMSEQVKSAW